MLIFNGIYLTSKETSKSISVNLELKWKSLESCVTFVTFDSCCYLSVCLAIFCITQSIVRP